ncbi:MAG: DNA mismatch repair endonuclease MutL [Desulfobacterales bacterium]|nr:DNA mismatch repair endonuclease MutL [Desulfobacterales bacterium]
MIKILPDILANKIAAGEVVERPSSVVKELLENSIDAESSKIIIEAEQGGRSLIQIADDGIGMNRDDALLSIERHATSKLFNDDDLFGIKTLGFRGEALPSIAAVSIFTMITKDTDSQTGIKIEISGGKIFNVSEIGAPKGTLISIKDIFFNVPARKKFLKTINTELGRILDIISSTAISFPSIQFKFIHNGKEVKNFLKAQNPLERITDVLGNDVKNNLHPINIMSNDISVSGWIASPELSRSTSDGIYLYINERSIRDKIIQKAIFEGYDGRLMKGRYPVAVVFIKMPYDKVDVNVHPAKSEVRFASQHLVYDAVKNAVNKVFQKINVPKWTPPDIHYDEPKRPKINTPVFFPEKKVAEDYFPYESKLKEHFEAEFKTEIKTKPETIPETRRDNQVNEQNTTIDKANSYEQTTLGEKKGKFSSLRLIGQFNNTYILCESDEGLIIIDQHASHERIVYEKLKQNYDKKQQQMLLIPEIFNPGFKHIDNLIKIIYDLNKLGFEVEFFGNGEFVIKSVPVILSDKKATPIIMDILENIYETNSPKKDEIINECLMTMACHGAIRANQHLNDQEMKDILAQMDKIDNPSFCPHGRPTWINWDIKFLEKSFGRTL